MKKYLIILYLIVVFCLMLILSCSEATSPQYSIEQSACTSCEKCIDTCPYDAIEVNENGKAEIIQSKCIKCGDCVIVCPEGAVN